MKKIDIFIAGFQKAGTTSLLRYLSENPRVLSHPQVEMSYFYNDAEFSKGYNNIYNNYFSFNHKNGDYLLLAKNANLATKVEGIKRLYSHNPETKIILILREPVERAYSAYLMNVRNSGQKMTFEEMIDYALKNKSHWFYYHMILGFGVYAKHIKSIYSIFPKKNVYLLLSKELKDNPDKQILNISTWLGIEAWLDYNKVKIYNRFGKPRSQFFQKTIIWFLRENNPIKKILKTTLPNDLLASIGVNLREINLTTNTSAPPISNTTREKLKAFYRPHNEKLMDITGLNVQHWIK